MQRVYDTQNGNPETLESTALVPAVERLKEAGIDLRTGMRVHTEKVAEQTEDEMVEKLDEDLEAFLDAMTYMEKIKVLERIRKNLNEYRMSSIEISLDLPVGNADLERRYQIVIDNLETRMRFECGRLR